ncbi:MAG: pyruvate kinase [Clostridia bacterium]|nr:pyruvate kinase [Clostridia bacterium]
MNKTKIVCTIGPACSDLETLKKMMKAGMDVARFNMSHGTHESHKKLMDLVKQARFELGLPVAIMLDTRGPEIRIKQFKDGKVVLKHGQAFALTTENVVGDETIVSVTYSKLPTIVREGTRILLNDGFIELVVVKVTETVIHTKVVNGGELSNNKSINIPSVELNMDYLSKNDKSDLEFGVQEGVDCYSISFVNSAADVECVRKFLKSKGLNDAFIISKIESAKGVEKMEEIIAASDGVMVARGDMGVEIPFERLPNVQKEMIAIANKLGKYSITATQMLESMIVNARPTRAEISDIANAIYDGTSAIMLSGETSAGQHPILAVETMQKIATETEKTLDNKKDFFKNNFESNDVTQGIGYASCALASSLNAKAIIVTTNTGTSAEAISRFRPNADIIALTPHYNIFFRLGMLWGVYPILDKVYFNTDELVKSAKEKAKQFKYVKTGDVVIQTASVVTGESGSNMLIVTKV